MVSHAPIVTDGATRRYTSKHYVRSILFSTKRHRLFSGLNVITKVFFLLMLSMAMVRVITEPVPDIVIAMAITVSIALLFYDSGSTKFLVSFYMFGFMLAMLVLLFWWLVFNQTAGASVLFFAAFYGIPFRVTTLSLEVGLAKVIGYSALFLGSLLFLMTTRDREIIDFLNALGLPFRAIVFTSIVIRNFDLMSTEFESIRKAQIARGLESGRWDWVTRRARDMVGISIPLTASMLRRSVEVGTALEARGFGNAKAAERNSHALSFRWVDAAAAAVCIAMVVLAYSVNFTLLVVR
jgi:energy-coupling factor transport system permease protein